MINRNPKLTELLTNRHENSEREIYEDARSQFAGSDEEFREVAQQYSDLAPEKKGAFLKSHNISVQNPAFSLAVSPEMGEFLFNLVLTRRPASVLELGSSYGVSTLYFAEALRVIGGGRVTATEMDSEKCASLRNDIRAVGLSDYVEVHEGDVFETVNGLQGPYDMVFIDIWANGYLDIFKSVEPLLAPGSIVLADNMFTAFEETRPFKSYLCEKPNICATTLAFESGVEYAVIV